MIVSSTNASEIDVPFHVPLVIVPSLDVPDTYIDVDVAPVDTKFVAN